MTISRPDHAFLLQNKSVLTIQSCSEVKTNSHIDNWKKAGVSKRGVASPVRQLASPWTSPSVGQPDTQSVGRSAWHTVCRSVSLTHRRSVSLTHCWSVSLTHRRSISLTHCRSVSLTHRLSVSQPDTQSVGQPDTQSVGQPDTQSIGQSAWHVVCPSVSPSLSRSQPVLFLVSLWVNYTSFLVVDGWLTGWMNGVVIRSTGSVTDFISWLVS